MSTAEEFAARLAETKPAERPTVVTSKPAGDSVDTGTVDPGTEQAAARATLDLALAMRNLAALDRLLAARNRAAAEVDRREAALDRQRAAEYLRQAYRDPLTGVLQREAGRDQLRQRIDYARRAETPLLIAFLDVDGLKRRNDEYGHHAGDLLLRELGTALRAGLRSYDLVMRYGGDEFVCALVDTTVAEAAARFHQINLAWSRAVPGASFSVGVVELATDEHLDAVVARADDEMYRRKRTRGQPPQR